MRTCLVAFANTDFLLVGLARGVRCRNSNVAFKAKSRERRPSHIWRFVQRKREMPAYGTLSIDNATLQRDRHSMSAVICAQFGEDALHMAFYCRLRHRHL